MRIALYMWGMTGVLAVWPVAAQWREVKPEDEPALFRSDVSLVRVDAEVLLGSKALLGLKQKDFQVYDNGTRREITHFSHENAPLDLLLIFDVSGSMRPVVEMVAESAQQALSQLRDGDRVGIMVFTTSSRMVQPFTTNIDAAVDAIEEKVLSQPFNGGTHLHEAIADAALEFMREKPGDRRRAIVVVTDNRGQRTRSDDGVIRLLWEADATASGVIVPSPAELSRGGTIPTGWPMPRRRGGWQIPPIGGGGPTIGNIMGAGMDKVAEESGGDMLVTNNPGASFAALVERLRSRYNLYYAMPEGTAGEKRQVRVELAGEAAARHTIAQVRARKGYVVPGAETTGRGRASQLSGRP
jgi:VWFA-related protein